LPEKFPAINVIKEYFMFKDYPLHQLSSVVFFLLPLLVLSYLYIRMGLSLYQAKLWRLRTETVCQLILKHPQMRSFTFDDKIPQLVNL
jgi:hypothetical protein